MKAPNRYTGSSFNSFLEEEGLLNALEAAAIRRVMSWKLTEQAPHSSTAPK